jgi:hypothetical protein
MSYLLVACCCEHYASPTGSVDKETNGTKAAGARATARGQAGGALLPRCPYSHSIVPGGLEVMSRVTRLTPRHSLMMRFEARSRRS